MRLHFVAPASSYTGYGLHLTEIVTRLDAMGIFATVRAVHVEEAMGLRLPEIIRTRLVKCAQPEPWEILLAPPRVPVSFGKRTLYYTMWESDTLPKDCVAILNKAEVICVPCHWNRETFHWAGVTRPIHIVPLGVDEKIYKPAPLRMDGPCVFGTAGRLAHGIRRKGVLDVIDLFLEAFPNDEKVELHIKVHPDCPVPKYPDWPWLKVIKAHISPSEVAAWLHGLTCYVSMARGEGWGLWQQQAMACARPCIAAVYGGLREYMHPDNCFPVDYLESKAEDGYIGNWANIDRASVIWRMREVYRNREAATAAGLRAAEDAGRFTWDLSIKRLMEVFNAVANRKPPEPWPHKPYPQRFDIKVPDPILRQLGHHHQLECDTIPFEGDRLHFNTTLARWNDEKILLTRSAVIGEDGKTTDNRVEVYSWEGVVPKFMAEVKPPLDTDWIEDPRIIPSPLADDRLISFTRVKDNMAFQMVGLLDASHQLLWRNQPAYGRNILRGPEKNWAWFWCHGHRSVYQMRPHVVLAIDDRGITEVLETRGGWDHWGHGQPRAGTPPIQIGDEFFALFHSSLPKTGYNRQYFAGAYAFDANPPHRITRITPAPLLYGRHDSDQPVDHYQVIFPMGALYDNGKWLVTAGVNDARTIWWRMDHDWLLNKMVEV